MQWLTAHWPAALAMALAVLPTLIVGLTRYPRLHTAAMVALDVLSAVTHRDSPGTFKLPLAQRSAAPDAVGRMNLVGKDILSALLPLVMLVAISGCATGQSPLTSTYQTSIGVVKSLDTTMTAGAAADGIYQKTIATDPALSAAVKHAKLASYRADRAQRAIPVVNGVKAAVDAGPAILQLVSDGVKKQPDAIAWLDDVVAALEKINGAFAALGVTPPAVKAASLDGTQIAAIVTGSLTGAASIAGGIVGIVNAVRSMGAAPPDQQPQLLAAAVAQFDTDFAALLAKLADNDAAADQAVGP